MPPGLMDAAPGAIAPEDSAHNKPSRVARDPFVTPDALLTQRALRERCAPREHQAVQSDDSASIYLHGGQRRCLPVASRPDDARSSVDSSSESPRKSRHKLLNRRLG